MPRATASQLIRALLPYFHSTAALNEAVFLVKQWEGRRNWHTAAERLVHGLQTDYHNVTTRLEGAGISVREPE